MKKMTSLLLAGCLFTLGSAWAEQTTVRFGLEALYPPFEYKTPEGDLAGFDVDLGNAVCEAAKVQCTWTEASFDGLIPALQARKFDVINSAMNVTEKRRQAIDFTDVIYHIPSLLIARADSGLLPTVASLRGKQVGVLQSSVQESYANAHWAPKGVNVVAYQDQDQVYQDLEAGRLDATLVMAAAGRSGFLSQPMGKGFAFVGGAVEDESILGRGIAFGLRKGDDALRQRLNTAIAEVKAKGTINELSKKYFGGLDVTAK
ncbi:ABC transporter substrate-binding protein [Lonsdalea quercina]|uniref:ABC transporter substrate-binding protein n=1 Tax=Lonsdalea quercina TaxID=71657 RepID=UPI003975DB6E